MLNEKVALITGSCGLIGSESVKFFHEKGFTIIGIDNDMRKIFFGNEASTNWKHKELETEFPDYVHYNIDIRNEKMINSIFNKYNDKIKIVIHTAAQPSHDWATTNPFIDFTVNANGTLILLEATRKYCKNSVFIFTSTNKVYGENPNKLPLIENETRWEIDKFHQFKDGINESMSIDYTKHSLFGSSKLAADILVQEYGKYFGMKTVCFRCGCLTGSGHSSTELHGFLSYLMKCNIVGKNYNIFGYKGKQVRDNIHSYDLVNAFWNFYLNPKLGGEVYNIGGGRHSNCSVIEAIRLCEELTNKHMLYSYSNYNRTGDHIWWISDFSKFTKDYPEWKLSFNIKDILKDIMTNSFISLNGD